MKSDIYLHTDNQIPMDLHLDLTIIFVGSHEIIF
jgi:hypothetical protein